MLYVLFALVEDSGGLDFLVIGVDYYSFAWELSAYMAIFLYFEFILV
jgi:hypothetical protein